MSQSIKIFLPIVPENSQLIYKGYVCNKDQREIIIYITEYTTNYSNLAKYKFCANTILGYYKNDLCELKMGSNFTSYFMLEKQKNLQFNILIIDGKHIDVNDNVIVLLYDYNRIKNSEALDDSDEYFSKLQFLMQDNTDKSSNTSYEPFLRCPNWLTSSMFVQHFLNYLNLINWLVNTIKRDKKFTIKSGNLILALITDVLLGYIALEFLIQEKQNISSLLMGVLEKLVNLLFSLLKWLMGAPAGLKLNNAFNKMLGKYFSYHIQLWWLFLDVSGEKLDTILHIYFYLGYLGITFQAAMILDMTCIATFHAYCIYVYAARLFNIQVSGLIALLRLFVGRKYNPLRGGIDSCEYTNQELFVGTVAFTILLLLLPTTTMYYIVFTLFRLMSLLVQHTLVKIIHSLQTLPLYIVTLWLANSPKLAGNILIEVENKEEGSPLVLSAKLSNKGIQELMTKFRAPLEAPKQFEWTNVLSNIFTGKQLI